jgi:hypothetical protein
METPILKKGKRYLFKERESMFTTTSVFGYSGPKIYEISILEIAENYYKVKYNDKIEWMSKNRLNEILSELEFIKIL